MGSHSVISESLMEVAQERNDGGKEVQFPRRRIFMGAPNDCGGTEKSQQCHKYFLQYSTFASEHLSVRI